MPKYYWWKIAQCSKKGKNSGFFLWSCSVKKMFDKIFDYLCALGRHIELLTPLFEIDSFDTRERESPQSDK